MKKNINSLSKEDISNIKEAVKYVKHRIRNNIHRPDLTYDDNFPPDVYICFVPEDIPKRVGKSIKGKDCQIGRTLGDDEDLEIDLAEDGELTEFVLNLSETTDVPKNSWQIIQRDKFGEWYVNPFQISSTTEEGTGTATATSTSTASSTASSSSSSSSTSSSTTISCVNKITTVYDVRYENGLLNKYQRILSFGIEDGCPILNEGVWKFKETLGCISKDCIGTSTSTSTEVPVVDPYTGTGTGTGTVVFTGTGTGTGSGDKCLNRFYLVTDVTYGPYVTINDEWFEFIPETTGAHHLIINVLNISSTLKVLTYWGTCFNLTEIEETDITSTGTYCIDFIVPPATPKCPTCSMPDTWTVTLAGEHIAGTFTVPFDSRAIPICKWKLRIDGYADFPDWDFLEIEIHFNEISKEVSIFVSGYKGGTFDNVIDYLIPGTDDCAKANTNFSIITDFYKNSGMTDFSDISIVVEPGPTTPTPIIFALTGSAEYEVSLYQGTCEGNTGTGTGTGTSSGDTGCGCSGVPSTLNVAVVGTLTDGMNTCVATSFTMTRSGDTWYGTWNGTAVSFYCLGGSYFFDSPCVGTGLPTVTDSCSPFQVTSVVFIGSGCCSGAISAQFVVTG